MVSVSEATSIINSHLFNPAVTGIAVNEAVNRVLAEEIKADRDFPPFNRVAMDGIAIQHQQLAKGQSVFPVEGVAGAGQAQKQLNDSTNCLEVMTGAPLPENTDTVVRYEDVEVRDGKAKIIFDQIEKGQNIHRRGQDAEANEALLNPRMRLSPAEVALIASVGKLSVNVYTLPQTAIISTGDELVDIDKVPAPHQIRRSNSYALQAALRDNGCTSTLFHLHDNKQELEGELPKILDKHDLLILSGGVSKGKFDFIPEVLTGLGVEMHFHGVSQKPGKPFWFGTRGSKTVFALPGNPVSTYMCFYKYIKPWLAKSLGLPNTDTYAVLESDFNFEAPLTYFLQVKVVNERGHLVAYPIPGGGSGDFANLKEVNGFLELPKGQSPFKKGNTFPVHLFRNL